MRGEGEMASAIHRLFEVQCGKLGLNRERFKFNTAAFRRPEPVKSGRPVRKDQSLQMELFDHP
jgi:hypothetical protein